MPIALYAEQQAVAEQAAVAAGRVLTDLFGKARAWEKGRADLVTEADLASQKLIAETLLGSFSSHTLLAEEAGAVADPAIPWRWIVDPLDGTMNYAHGLPLWCVSIALEFAGRLVVGVVHAPTFGPSGATFSASEGRGTTLNGEPVRVSPVDRLENSLISTGWPADISSDADRLMALLRRFSLDTHSIRRTGTSAWNLAMVAAGGFEAYYGTAMNPWDSAAGALLVQEAGGTVTTLDGGPCDIYNPAILASNGHIHRAALAAVREATPMP